MVHVILRISPFIFSLFLSCYGAELRDDFAKCSTECPVSTSPKFSYESGMTYTYDYTGSSKLSITKIDGAETEMTWNAEVKLTILGPCDVAISMTKPVWGDSIDTDHEERLALTRYPLVIAMTNGRVQHVCTHPDDEPWSINLKKGVASAFQNSLPSISIINSGLTFMETDVVGECPTKYHITELEAEHQTLIKKVKNYQNCQRRYPSPSELPLALLKTPLPLDDSGSECQQDVNKGIIINIVCHDRNTIKPMYGLYKYIVTDQWSKLSILYKSEDQPSSLSSLDGKKLVKSNLLYDDGANKKDESLVAELEVTMREICGKTMDNVEKDAAPLMSRAINLLRGVPDAEIERTLHKIRIGHYCSSYRKLEMLFLDALAFINEPGAVRPMVNELISGEASGFRSYLYSAAFFLTPRPNRAAIESLRPLFESSDPRLALAVLNSAAMVNTYCRHYPQCYRDPSVQQLSEILSQRIQEKCSPLAHKQAINEAIAALKALGNVGVMTTEVADTVLKCLESSNLANYVRVIAAHSFRNMKCENQVTDRLVDLTLNPAEDSEIRIVSFLEAVRCMSRESLQKVIAKIGSEDNDQVRGFILSYLINLQKSTAPYKEHLRYLLSNLPVPNNFTEDIVKYSRNVDLSYFVDSVGLGYGLESNVVYVPGSFTPRLLDLNLTTSLGSTLMNIGEFGVRFEGLDSLMRTLFGPGGYLNNVPALGEIVSNFFTLLGEKELDILDELKEKFIKRAFNPKRVSDFLRRLYKHAAGKMLMMNFYVRLNGQETLYGSHHFDFSQSAEQRQLQIILSFMKQLFNPLVDTNIDITHMGQVSLQYNLPTIQGIPIKLELDGTAVYVSKMESHLPNVQQRKSGPIWKLHPSLSLQVDDFIGFDAFLGKNGIVLKNLATSDFGASVQLHTDHPNRLAFNLDLPEVLNFFDLRSEAYLIVRERGKNETQIVPSTSGDARPTSEECQESYFTLGELQLCNSHNIPDPFLSNVFPFGKPVTYKFYVKRRIHRMKGYSLSLDIHQTDFEKFLEFDLHSNGGMNVHQTGNFTYSVCDDSFNLGYYVGDRNGLWHTAGCIYGINRGREKYIELLLKPFNSVDELKTVVKFELVDNSSSTKKNIVFNIYWDQFRYPVMTHIFQTILAKEVEGDKIFVKLDFGTVLPMLLPYYQLLDFKFKVLFTLQKGATALGVLPIGVQDFYFHINRSTWSVKAFLRPTDDSLTSYASYCDFITGITVFSITGDHHMQRTPQSLCTMENTVTVKSGENEYNFVWNLYNEETRKGLQLSILKNSGTPITNFEMMHIKSENSYSTQFLVNVPSCIKSIHFENVATERKPNTYQIEASLKHSDDLVLHCRGLLTVLFSSKVSSIQAHVSVSSITGGPHNITTTMIFSKKKQNLAFSLAGDLATLFAIEWKMTDRELTDYGFKLYIRNVIDNKVNLGVSQQYCHLGFDNVFMLSTLPNNRWKGFVDVDLPRKKVKGDLSWDADQDPTKICSVEVTVASRSCWQHCKINGGWSIIGHKYQVSAEVDLHSPSVRFSGENVVKFHIGTPTRKTMSAESKWTIHYEMNDVKVNTLTLYKDLEDRNFELTTLTTLSDLAGKFNFALTSFFNLRHPERTQTSIQVETRHQTLDSLGEVFFKMKIADPALSKPLETKFTLNKKHHAYSAVWTVQLNMPEKGASFEVVKLPGNVLKAFDLNMDLTTFQDLMVEVEKVLDFQAKHDVSQRGETKRLIYCFHYERIHSDSSLFKIQIPSRTLEIESTSLPSRYTIKIAPNTEESEGKYTLQLRKFHKETHNGQELKFESHLQHPKGKRKKSISIHYRKQGDKIEGEVVLDLLPSPRDKITGKTTLTILSAHSIAIETVFNGRILKITPKITLTLAFSSAMKSFDIAILTNSTDPPALHVSGKIDRIGSRKAAMAFHLVTHGINRIEFSGSLVPQDHSVCDGLKLTGKSIMGQNGRYDISAQLCVPGAAKVTLGDSENNWSHEMMIGMPSMREAYLVAKTFNSINRWTKPLMVRAAVNPSQLLSLDFEFNLEMLERMKKSYKSIVSGASKELKLWLMEIRQDIIVHDPETSVALEEASGVMNGIANELSEIIRDASIDATVVWDVLKKVILNNSIIQRALRNYFDFWGHFLKVTHHLELTSSRMIDVIFREFGDPEKQFVKGMQRFFHLFQTGEIVQEILLIIKQSSGVAILEHEIEARRWLSPRRIQGLRHIAFEILSSLEKDTKSLWVYLNSIPDMERIVQSVQGLDMKKVILRKIEAALHRTVQRSIMLSLETKSEGFQISLPLRHQAQSLRQALFSLSYNPLPILDLAPWSSIEYSDSKDLWTLSSYLAVSSFPPWHSRTGMLIGDHEILTFDGEVLRAPNAHCIVILVAHRSFYLTAQYPFGLAKSKLTLIGPFGTVVINHKHQVKINGNNVIRDYAEKGIVEICKSRFEIQVSIPLMTLRVNTVDRFVSVELSGWTFGQVAGLVGTFDGEAGNDWLMPSGKRAKDLQQLVMSWQEDQHCRIPAIRPAKLLDISFRHFAQCQAFVGINTPCNGIIRKDTFLRICYATANPCDVAKAYHDLCSIRMSLLETIAYVC